MIEHTTGTFGRAIDWTFRDRTTGGITIAQSPNPPLWIFLILTALAWLAEWMGGSFGPAAGWLRIAAHLALVWWAVDEIVRGVNPWRRFLGAITLIGLATLYALPRGIGWGRSPRFS